MFSEAGKIFEKCKRIKPLNRAQRQRVYASCQMPYEISKESKKIESFNTISRSARDSYLLRVTKQSNTGTNYQLNYDKILKRERRSTIDQAQFKRMIGPVNDRDYSIEPNKNRDHRCIDSFLEMKTGKKPLTARETHTWRKTHQHLDFQKQINPQRLQPQKDMKSTQDSFIMNTLEQITESNFNNYKRFSFVSHCQKSHDFNSNSGHKYLQQVLTREIEPQYNILANNQQFFRKSMKKPKGELRFGLFKNQIKTRVDRNDPHWAQTLDYSHDTTQNSKNRNRSATKTNGVNFKKYSTLDFDLQTYRRDNVVHSEYPIRQSLQVQVPRNCID